MNELTIFKGNEVFTTSLVIADGTGLQNQSVIQTIRNKADRLKKFGKLHFIDFKSTKSKGRPQKICYLNEMQATLLMTYLDNSEVVDDFKEELVRQFYEMRQVLMQKKTDLWIEERKTGILCRKDETDVIKKLVEYAKEQKSSHADMLYITYTNLANKAAGIKTKMRDYASVEQLQLLKQVEHIIERIIKVDMEIGKHYKEIYKDCKTRLEQFLQIGFIDNSLLIAGR